MLTGVVSNIQKFSLHDGPGIRTTVFLKGCPLHCAWCHNPENISPQPEIVVLESRCVRCGQCIEVCPQQKGRPAEKEPFFYPAADCQVCGACVEACPSGARSMMGKEMSVDDLLSEIFSDRTFFEESGGGVTFSGGEPLLQFDFLKAMLQTCRREGLHTAVDTCGFAPRENFSALAQVADLFLYDLKFVDAARHRHFTGVSNEIILDNLKFLAAKRAGIWLRIPIIPGVNDSPAELERLAHLAGSLPVIQQINLLPYHKTGIQKFKRLGREYPLAEVTPPSVEYMEAVAEKLSSKGLNVRIGG